MYLKMAQHATSIARVMSCVKEDLSRLPGGGNTDVEPQFIKACVSSSVQITSLYHRCLTWL